MARYFSSTRSTSSTRHGVASALSRKKRAIFGVIAAPSRLQLGRLLRRLPKVNETVERTSDQKKAAREASDGVARTLDVVA
jgi:hypothetical protein